MKPAGHQIGNMAHGRKQNYPGESGARSWRPPGGLADARTHENETLGCAW